MIGNPNNWLRLYRRPQAFFLFNNMPFWKRCVLVNICQYLVNILSIPSWHPLLRAGTAVRRSASRTCHEHRRESIGDQLAINRQSYNRLFNTNIIYYSIFNHIIIIFIWIGKPNNCLRLYRRPQAFSFCRSNKFFLLMCVLGNMYEYYVFFPILENIK